MIPASMPWNVAGERGDAGLDGKQVGVTAPLERNGLNLLLLTISPKCVATMSGCVPTFAWVALTLTETYLAINEG